VKQSFAAIILGGTGQVGGAAVAELLAISECREVVMVTRKPTAPRSRVRNNLSQRPSSYFVLGGYDGLKSLLIVSKKVTGITMPLFFRVNARACSTS
jgi:uncharacterized protein YbjT (DUF2867 family)